jgi:nucleoside-diphosphate-sugar epimerase
MASPSSSLRRPTLLIVGCGDVGLRVLRLLQGRWRVLALTSSVSRLAELRAAGAVPLVGNLDDAHSLWRIANVADAVLHLAPPPNTGVADPRTQALLRVLARGGRVRRVVYGSTTGVYGDCAGARFDETRAVAPATERAQRRVHAEAAVRHFGRSTGATVSVLRIPGIYATDRPGGHPRERLLRGAPVLLDAQDVYTNHIHADDLARACLAALLRGAPQRVYHVTDNTDLKMGAYLDLTAELYGLPKPERVSRAEAATRLSPMTMSFMSESRRLLNQRLRQELRFKLRYATVEDGLREGARPTLP